MERGGGGKEKVGFSSFQLQFDGWVFPHVVLEKKSLNDGLEPACGFLCY